MIDILNKITDIRLLTAGDENVSRELLHLEALIEKQNRDTYWEGYNHALEERDL